jgi:hypothetical protein
MLSLTSKVVMLVMLVGPNGSQTTGVVNFDDYESCYVSLHRPISGDYVHTERVCMSTEIFDRATLVDKKNIKDGGPKSKEW